MTARMTMIYWKREKFWLGNLLERPHVTTQGRALKKLEEDIKDAYRIMVAQGARGQGLTTPCTGAVKGDGGTTSLFIRKCRRSV